MQCNKSYHLYTHANGFENLFLSDENYRYFLSRYEHFIPSVADTLAYCLMPNHIHFLIRIKTEAEIISKFLSPSLQTSKVSTLSQTNLGGLEMELVEKRISQQFSNLFNSYTKSFNKMYSRRGSLFIPNFKRKEITDNSYFTQLIYYIHANPVHHGFVKNIGDWRWSSFSDIVQAEPSLVKREEIIQWFGNKEEYLRFHQRAIQARTHFEMDT